jgi:hypothetical protein
MVVCVGGGEQEVKDQAGKKYTWLTFKISQDGKSIVTDAAGTGTNYSNADKKLEVENFPAVCHASRRRLTLPAPGHLQPASQSCNRARDRMAPGERSIAQWCRGERTVS